MDTRRQSLALTGSGSIYPPLGVKMELGCKILIVVLAAGDYQHCIGGWGQSRVLLTVSMRWLFSKNGSPTLSLCSAVSVNLHSKECSTQVDLMILDMALRVNRTLI